MQCRPKRFSYVQIFHLCTGILDGIKRNMTLYKNKYRVETTRLKGWDYSSAGNYFVTICVKNREHLFGYVAHGEMVLNPYGKIVEQCWFDLPKHYPNIKLDAFRIMPNHIHGIIVIDNGIGDGMIDGMVVETGFKPVSTTNTTNQKHHGLFEFIRALKTFSARRINEMRHSVGETVWQSRFHDHIIRDNSSLERIRKYIINNPKTWDGDLVNK